jgi:hypothetical protein
MSRRYVIGALCTLLALGTQTAGAAGEVGALAAMSRSGQLLVTVASPSAPAALSIGRAMARDYGLEETQHWRIAALDLYCFVFAVSSGKPVADVVVRLRADHRAESVQPMNSFRLAAANTIDPYENLQYSLTAARIDEAHRYATGKHVKVAIIDTGIDSTHPDLRYRIIESLNFVEADQTLEFIEFHGTAVAGIIAAEANNGKGIVGVAPQADLYSLRACYETVPGEARGQCSTAALARALDWAILSGAKVINMSLQGEHDPLVSRMITRAVEHGAVVVAATDLNRGKLAFPASLSTVIAVIGAPAQPSVAYANRRSNVFTGPSLDILTTMPDSTYDFVSGSSFASAHVAGIVALIAEIRPQVTTAQVVAIFTQSTALLGWPPIIDACLAVDIAIGERDCQTASFTPLD